MVPELRNENRGEISVEKQQPGLGLGSESGSRGITRKRQHRWAAVTSYSRAGDRELRLAPSSPLVPSAPHASLESRQLLFYAYVRRFFFTFRANLLCMKLEINKCKFCTNVSTAMYF